MVRKPLPHRMPTTPLRSRIMSAVRSSGNKTTEERLIIIMRRHGITGWRRRWPLLGKPDFVFPESRLIVFVDGCFWHGCPRCYTAPKQNAEFWAEKVRRNISRDRKNERKLRAEGWHVVRIWEHALKNDVVVANRIRRLLR